MVRFLGAVISFIITVYLAKHGLDLWKSNKKIKSLLFWYFAFCGIMVIVTFIIGTNTTSTTTNQSTEQIHKQSSKKTNKSKTSLFGNKKNIDSNSNKDAKKATKVVKKWIDQDKGWADGSLDEDGNPTDNGTPNPTYAWANFVNDVKVTGDSSNYQLEINLGGADELTKVEKNEVVHKANSAATAALVSEGMLDTDKARDKLYVTIKSGNVVVGHTKVLNHSEIKWY